MESHTRSETEVRVIRLCVVGNTCGKTCLISMFLNNEFPDSYVPTQESENEVLLEILETKVRLVIYEVGSEYRQSKRFREVASMVDCFMIVYNSNDYASFKEVERIFEQIATIRTLSRGSSASFQSLHCTIAATQKDGDQWGTGVPPAEGRRLSRHLGCHFEEVSAKSNLNVFKAFYATAAALIVSPAVAVYEDIIMEGPVYEVTNSLKGRFLSLFTTRAEPSSLSLKGSSLIFERKALLGNTIQIPLASASCEEHIDESGEKYFSLVTYTGDVFSFRGQSAQNTELWAQCIRKAVNQSMIFGGPIERCVLPNHDGMNTVIYKCVEYLVARNGIKHEGIFRIPGSVDSIRALRFEFELKREQTDIMSVPDINTVSGLLKLYLGELPGPIIPRVISVKLLDLRAISSPVTRIISYEDTLNLLPAQNLTNLKHILWFLFHVHRSHELNKMNSRNLAMVLGPNIYMGGLDDSSLLATLPRFVPVLAELIEFYELMFVKARDPSSPSNRDVKTNRRKVNMGTLKGYPMDESSGSQSSIQSDRPYSTIGLSSGRRMLDTATLSDSMSGFAESPI